MGCGPSKAAEQVDETKQEEKKEPPAAGAAASPNDVKVKVPEEPAKNAAGRRVSKTVRRIAVRAETQDDMTEENFAPSTTEKTSEQTTRIMAGIDLNELLSGLSEVQKQFVVGAMIEVQCESDDVIISQGEDGDHFYMVDSGTYEVFLKQAEENKPVATYESGKSFGELALLYNSPRAATIKCKEAGVLWALERKAFRHVMVNTGAGDLKNKAENFLKTVEILSPLTDAQRASLANCMEELSFNDGEYVVEMGDVADALYFVKEGELVCHTGGQGEDKDKIRLKQGAVFGESCLEPTAQDAVRKANVVAVGKVKILKLTRAAFLEQLGDLSDVVADNFKRKVLDGMMIDGTPIFSKLAVEDQVKFMSSLTEQHFDDGVCIIEQGKDNNVFYVMKGGTVSVLQDQGGSPKELAQLTAGQFFGERALLKDEPANATIKAQGAVTCYICSRESFTSILGPLQDLIDAEVKRRERAAEVSKKPQPKWEDLELRRILGVGTFGRVKLVLHKPSDTAYALKCMRKQQVVATKQQSHVLNEKRILAAMDHPFILRLVSTYQDEGELYMLMELGLGGELFSLLAKKAPLRDEHARFYSASVVSIFAYMHGLKVVYRDLKPENLLLDEKGYLKMVDFGFAKVVQDRTWTLCGTPEYLAPEIILNKGHAFGADWWCVGILTYECLTGTTPFVSNDPMEGYRKIIKCRVPWPANFSALAKDFMDRLIVVDPQRRLGCLKNGPAGVKEHQWFNGLDWKGLEAKKLPTPHTPKIKSQLDDSNFDEYEDEGIANYPDADFPKDMFIDFAETWVGK
jgi:cGMP-dependent protein kinase